ncbi:C-type lectin domain family 4 member F [Labeo rohita]|uniref:C-type lectin domain family 4 member F n=1 Tax=Labeo rohita TaxID=84645 RepID=A0ABQ8L8A3_LABRO|nr:C-type lectin domain family 4 member F [Labeo rohita]
MGLNKSLICSDSSSALLCLDAQQSETRQDIVLEILQLLYMLHHKIVHNNKIVQFLWFPGRHFHSVQSMVSKGRNSRGSRKEDCVHSKLRLGHTGLNSTLNIIGKHSTGLCDWCGIRETAEQVLIQCNRYTEEEGN